MTPNVAVPTAAKSIPGFPLTSTFRDPALDDPARKSAVPVRVDYSAKAGVAYAVLPIGIYPALDEAANKAMIHWPEDTFCMRLQDKVYAYVDLDHFDDLRTVIEEAGVAIALNVHDVLRIETYRDNLPENDVRAVFNHGMAIECAGGEAMDRWEAYEMLRARMIELGKNELDAGPAMA